MDGGYEFQYYIDGKLEISRQVIKLLNDSLLEKNDILVILKNIEKDLSKTKSNGSCLSDDEIKKQIQEARG
jgi:uncharacterized membrane protein YvbJ